MYFFSLSQIGTGFKDDDLDQHYSYLKERTISAPKPYYRWSESVTPDHWFDSSQLQVWERERKKYILHMSLYSEVVLNNKK